MIHRTGCRRNVVRFHRLSAEHTAQLKRLYAACGSTRASKLLKTSPNSVEELASDGGLTRPTVDRIALALDALVGAPS